MKPRHLHFDAPQPGWTGRFTDREVELAHQIRALGLKWEPIPGMFVYDDEERFSAHSPIQEHIFVILDLDLFSRLAGGRESLRDHFTWLPTFEEAYAWLLTTEKNEAEILDRVREMVVDTGLTCREACYELIVAALQARRTPTP